MREEAGRHQGQFPTFCPVPIVLADLKLVYFNESATLDVLERSP